MLIAGALKHRVYHSQLYDATGWKIVPNIKKPTNHTSGMELQLYDIMEWNIVPNIPNK